VSVVHQMFLAILNDIALSSVSTFKTIEGVQLPSFQPAKYRL